jgi:hypothetical protein
MTYVGLWYILFVVLVSEWTVVVKPVSVWDWLLLPGLQQIIVIVWAFMNHLYISAFNQKGNEGPEHS